jgi:hypothetical protein
MPNNPLEAILSKHPDLQSLRQVADEVERRAAKLQRLPIYRYSRLDSEQRPLAPPGSAVLFVARPGCILMANIKNAFRDSNWQLMREVAERIYGTLVDRQPRTLNAAVEEFIRQGASIDLAYRGTSLVQNVFLPDDLEIAAFPMPYSGGPLDDSSFTLTARGREGQDSWLEALLVIHEPKLTETERAALDLVASEDSAINIGKSAMCYAITAVTVFIVVAGATYACPAIFEEPHLDDDVVRQLGPSKTARELLLLRRHALERRSI